MSVNKKEKLKRIKNKLYQHVFNMPVDQLSVTDMKIFNLLTEDEDTKEYRDRYKDKEASSG